MRCETCCDKGRYLAELNDPEDELLEMLGVVEVYCVCKKGRVLRDKDRATMN